MPKKPQLEESLVTLLTRQLLLPESAAAVRVPDHATHPFHKTLTSHGFKHASSGSAESSSGEHFTNHTYHHPDRKTSSVSVNHEDGRWTHFNKTKPTAQTNSITGRTAEHLDKTLAAHHPNIQDPAKSPFHKTLTDAGYRHTRSSNGHDRKTGNTVTTHHYDHPKYPDGELGSASVEQSVAENPHKGVRQTWTHQRPDLRSGDGGTSAAHLKSSLDHAKKMQKSHEEEISHTDEDY